MLERLAFVSKTSTRARAERRGGRLGDGDATRSRARGTTSTLTREVGRATANVARWRVLSLTSRRDVVACRPVRNLAEMFLAFVCVFSLALARSTNAAACTGTATYELIFFNQITDTEPGVGSRHYSPLVAVAHESSWAPFTIGETASDGVKDVAEIGATSVIVSEAAARGAVAQVASTRRAYPQRVSAGYQVVQISVDATRPRLSALTMIAPSPDWFTGFANVSACNETTGSWLDEIDADKYFANAVGTTTAQGHFVVEAPLYMFPVYGLDAGTDSGSSFTAFNSATNPREAISYLSAASGGAVSLRGLSENNFLVGAMSARRTDATTTPTCTYATRSSNALTHGIGFTLGLALLYALV